MEIRKFIDYLKGEKKTSANTCDAYFRDLNAFRIFLTERGVTDMSEASSADVAAYLMTLKNEGKTRATANRKLSSIRSFYKYMHPKRHPKCHFNLSAYTVIGYVP